MNIRAYLAEFIGTFALVFVGVMVMINLGTGPGALVGIALAHGLVIAVLVSATMAISGGHLNPAVTLAFWMTRRIKIGDALAYIVAQCLGALVAAGTVFQIMGYEALSHGTLVTRSMEPMPALALEAIATFFLVFAVFGTAIDKRAPKVGGLYIGLSITMGILAIGPITGAALNPARWLGPALVGKTELQPMIYIAGPVLGALVAALVYQYVMMGRDQIPEPE